MGVAVPRPSLLLLTACLCALCLGLLWFGGSGPQLALAIGDRDDTIPVEVENAVRANGCLACHRAEGIIAERLAPVPARSLHAIGKRLAPEYLRQFLSASHEDRIGVTMPDLFGGFPPAERTEVIEDLVHYLGTRGGLFDLTPIAASPHEVDVGRELFETIGCKVCHDGGNDWRAQLAQKTNFRYVGEILRHPERAIPSGHMPSMGLTEDEARSISLFLLEDQSRDAAGQSLVLEVAGLRESYFEGAFPDCGPALEDATPVRVGVGERVGLPEGHREDYFAVALDGEIHIPASGRWEFTLFSDDGSRLWIDEKEIVNHDGLHGPTIKIGAVELAEGWHRVRVTMFEHGGGQELKLHWSGPGTSLEEVPGSAFRVRTSAYQPPGEKLAVNRDRRARGQSHYIQLGCAACHDRGMAPDGARSFATLPAEPAGCLDPSPSGGSRAPRFPMSDVEIGGILALLERRAEFEVLPTEERAVNLVFDRLGCDGCHARDGVGGPTDQTQHLFTGTAELGDEGRLPPDLTGIGAKLKLSWLERVLLEGASVRPYMTTRMPIYAQNHIEGLAKRLHRVDGGNDHDVPPFSDEAVAAGRFLAGGEGFRCIDCHDFAGHRSLGEPAIDLATVGERLQPGWYREYMLDPQSMRPGTRMPAFWTPGLDLFPDLLGGNGGAQIDATWSYLALGESAPLPSGLVVDRRTYDLIPVDEPILFGAFFEGLSGRVVCCGYPERISIAYDVEHTRLAKVWRGRFMNARGTWEGRAGQLETPEGSAAIDFPAGDAIAKIRRESEKWPKGTSRENGWRQRAIDRDSERRPVFRREHAEWGVTVEESITPRYSAEGSSIVRTVKVTGGDGSLMFRAWIDPELVRTDDGFEVPHGPKIRIQGGEAGLHLVFGFPTELRVAIPAGGATIEVEVQW